MTDDFSVFWQNNDTAAALFYELITRAQRGAYDDDFLARLAAYRTAGGSDVHADIFAAQYLLACGDAENAIVCGERSYVKRSMNCAVWKLLATAYEQVGRELDALSMRGHIQGMYPSEDFSLTLPRERQREGLDRFSLAANHTPYAPMLTNRACIEDNTLQFEPDIFIGEEIPLTMPANSNRHWVGIYVDEGFLSRMAAVHEPMRHIHGFFFANRDVTFDIQKAQDVTESIRIEPPEGTSLVVPVAGTQNYQNFLIQTAANMYPGYLGKWAFSYLRLDEPATLYSEAAFAVGTPIRLGHSPARKKLVLNLLIDGMCWPAVHTVFETHMPRIAKFFSRGVIFDQHFSASEYTLPSLPSLETGRYSHHTQIFTEKRNHELPLSVRTLAEEMADLGYYCSAPLSTGQNLYNGIYRGYHRLISSYTFQPAYEGTECLLRTLEAFPDVDHFMLYHTSDVHPINLQEPPKFSTEAERSVPLADRFVPLDPLLKSVNIPYLPILWEQMLVSLHHIDRSVGAILSYIEEHYREDEYIVNLYSDHGSAFLDPKTRTANLDRVGAYATGATWMIRGAGVPEGIRVQDMTSSVDIYPTLAQLCGFSVASDVDGQLPAIFGGTPRDAVYTTSQFPGQTFKLAVRTREHVLRVETQGFTGEDGTADFARATVGIYPRAHEFEDAYEMDSPELRAFFYPRAREFLHGIANNGEVFSS